MSKNTDTDLTVRCEKFLIDAARQYMFDHHCTVPRIRRFLEKIYKNPNASNPAKDIEDTIALLRPQIELQEKRIAISLADRYSTRGASVVMEKLEQKGLPCELYRFGFADSTASNQIDEEEQRNLIGPS